MANLDGEDLKSFSSWHQSRTISRTELVEIFGGEDAEDFVAYLTSVHGHRFLLSIPGWPLPFVLNARASAIFDINVSMGTDLGSVATLRQSRALLGEGLLVRPLLRLSVSRQMAPPVKRGTLVVPRRAWLPFQQALPKATWRTTRVLMRG